MGNCAVCDGTGYVPKYPAGKIACDVCEGTGFIDDTPCTEADDLVGRISTGEFHISEVARIRNACNMRLGK